MHVARVAFAALLAAAVFTSASSARADPRTQSRESFLRGVGQAHHGDYAEARDSFLDAYRLFPHPSILLNLGIAHLHTREFVAAEQDLVRFLSDDGGASTDEIASGRAALAEARAHIGTLRVRVSPDVARARLDADPVPLVPGAFAEVRATAGTHALRAEAEGYEPLEQTIDVPPARSTDIQITLAPLGQTPPKKPRSAAPSHALVGWSLVSAGAVLAGVGAVCGAEAISHASAYNNASGGASFQNPSVRSSGIAFRTAADLLFLAAIGTGGAGAYFLLAPGPAGPGPAPAGAKGAALGSGTWLVVRAGFAGVAGSF